jgi:REP element-mobilizing transposase RayT
MKGLEKFEPETYYHIVNHAVGNENLFKNDDNFSFFLRKYATYMPSVCDTLAYCLMPNHIHFLIRTHSEERLLEHLKYKSDIHKLVMQELSNLLNSYAKSYNKMYNRRGSLWIDFTKRFVINSDAYLSTVINYIHQNPVKHGFIKDLADWKYSSFNSILSEKPTLLCRNEVVSWFGSINDFKNYHQINDINLFDDWEF